MKTPVLPVSRSTFFLTSIFGWGEGEGWHRRKMDEEGIGGRTDTVCDTKIPCQSKFRFLLFNKNVSERY